jgi:copper chaperone CopZ
MKINYKKERWIMQKATINLETLSCPSCLQKIDNAVKGLDGVDEDSVKVMFNSSKVKANFDGDALQIEDIEKAIEDLGYPVNKSKVKAV